MKSFAAARTMRPILKGSSVPALVYESPKIPRVPLNSPLGIALGVTGGILVVDALLAIFTSQEQSTLSTVFRLLRLTAGGGLLVWVAASGSK
jgi:hypothetical protein